MNLAEIEFVRAIQAFKERHGRSFPTWSEVLHILKELGYSKGAQPDENTGRSAELEQEKGRLAALQAENKRLKQQLGEEKCRSASLQETVDGMALLLDEAGIE
jgi:hypothetical protein